MAAEKQTGSPLRVGVKYCGGCNPDYDRSEAVARIQQALSQRIRLTGPEEETDRVIAVQGCRTACADVGSLDDSKLLHIKGLQELESVISKLEKAFQSRSDHL